MVEMQYAARIFQVVGLDADDLDPAVISVGGFRARLADGSYGPGEPVFTSLSQITAAVVGVVRRVQEGLKFNVRFQIIGQPVGPAEIAENDLPAELRISQIYMSGDTPNPQLDYYIKRANRKPVENVIQAQFIPADAIAEPFVGVIQGPVAP